MFAIFLSLRFGEFLFPQIKPSYQEQYPWQGIKFPPWVPRLIELVFSCSYGKERVNLCIIIPHHRFLGVGGPLRAAFRRAGTALNPGSPALCRSSFLQEARCADVPWELSISGLTRLLAWLSGSGLQQIPRLTHNCSTQSRCKTIKAGIRKEGGTWFCATIFLGKFQSRAYKVVVI